MNRRSFVIGGTAVGIGVASWLLSRPQSVLVSTPSAPATSWFSAALSDMARTSRFGLLLAIPDGEEERRELGSALYATIEDRPLDCFVDGDCNVFDLREEQVFADRTAARELLRTTIIMVMTNDEIRTLARGSGNRVALRPDGSWLSEATVIENELEPGFADRLLGIVYGERLEHLESVVAELRASLDPTQRAWIERNLELVATAPADDPHLENARVAISTVAHSITPWIALAGRRDALPRLGSRLSRLLQSVAPFGKAGLPYGTEVPPFRSMGCGMWQEIRPDDDTRITIGCGMGRPTQVGRRYVRFLAS